MPDEIKEEVKLGDSDSATYAIMRQLADNDLDVHVDVNGDELNNRTKLFLIYHARSQLNRIIKLTNFLEKMEDKFIESVSDVVDTEPDSMRKIAMLAQTMETLSKCLDDANSIVFQVLKDEKFNNITINTTNIITPDGQSATIIDADSRDEVRNLASSLYEQLSKIASAQEGDVEVIEP